MCVGVFTCVSVCTRESAEDSACKYTKVDVFGRERERERRERERERERESERERERECAEDSLIQKGGCVCVCERERECMSERGIERKSGLKERERERKREEECLEDSPAQKDGYVGVCMSEKEIQRERALKICPQLLRMPKVGRKTLPCKKMDTHKGGCVFTRGSERQRQIQ